MRCNGEPVVGALVSGILPKSLERPEGVPRELDVGETGEDGCVEATIDLQTLPRESLEGQAMLITIGDANRSEVGRSPVSFVVE